MPETTDDIREILRKAYQIEVDGYTCTKPTCKP